MEIKPVKSSNVKEVGYDSETKSLHIGFLDGRKYLYESVPPEIYKALIEAKSIGGYINTQIKKSFKCKAANGSSNTSNGQLSDKKD